MSFKDTKVFKNLKKITYRIYNRIISTPFFQKMEVEPVTEDDFLPHNEYVIEWWYFTGFLNEKFGFEVTFFKVNVPPKNFIFVNPSVNTCISHFAITDIQEEKFSYSERIKQSILMWEKKELLLRNGAWILESDGSIYHIYVVSKEISLDLYMKPTSNMVLHGDEGLIKLGNAGYSYYYTIPSMETEGYIKRGGKLFKVNGETWHDHQWGNFKVEPAWDWFSIRLKDKTYLMAFNLWDTKRKKLVIQYASFVEKGLIKKFSKFAFKVLDEEFLLGKKRYPEIWELSIGKENIDFIIETMVKNQEVNSIITPDYYEGICKVKGKIKEKEIEGIAYVELTGYY